MTQPPQAPDLTEREKQIVAAIAQGQDMKVARYQLSSAQIQAGITALYRYGTQDAVYFAFRNAGVSEERVTPLSASYCYQATRNLVARERRLGRVRFDGTRWVRIADAIERGEAFR